MRMDNQSRATGCAYPLHLAERQHLFCVRYHVPVVDADPQRESVWDLSSRSERLSSYLFDKPFLHNSNDSCQANLLLFCKTRSLVRTSVYPRDTH